MQTFFISYNSADKDVAERVAQAIVDAGHKVRFDRWEVIPGNNVAAWMAEALEDAERMVALFSPDYIKEGAKYSALERNAMLWDDIDGKKAALIPLVVRPCKMPKIYAPLSRFDLAKISLTDFVAELTRTPKQMRALSGTLRTLVVNFTPGRQVVGRAAEVANLRQKLLQKSNVALVNPGAVLKGQGGVGKSTLARHYAETHFQDYFGAAWINASSRGALVSNLVAHLWPVLFPTETAPDPATEGDARKALQNARILGSPWLFIYDNVERLSDIADLIPQNAHLIVTTRAGTGWPGWQVLPTDVLTFNAPDAPATQLLMQTASRTDDAAGAMDLAADLGGLPLGLVVMGAYVRAQGGTWAENRARLAEVLVTEPENEGYPTSIRVAVQLSLNRLPPDAQIVANLCAWWAADGLTPELICNAPKGAFWPNWQDQVSEPIQSLAADPARTRSAFAALAASSLLTGEGGTYSMHRMTAAALRSLQGKESDFALAATALLAAVYPGKPSHSANWPLCKTLTPHIRALWDRECAPKIEAMDYLLNQSAVYLVMIADIQVGLAMARANYDLKLARLPPDHLAIAVALGTLGLALGRSGDLHGAESMLARAVTLHETHRPNSAELASIYNQHSSSLIELARAGNASCLPRARKRSQQCLDLRKTLFEPDAEPVAEALNSLASILFLMGDLAAAGNLLSEALTIDRGVLPPGDWRLASSLMNTGATKLESGAADQAEPLLEEALQILETTLADHPTHPNRRDAAEWLMDCLLVRAAVGENARLRRAQAKDLCNRYGFDFDDRVKWAKQYPYTPTKP